MQASLPCQLFATGDTRVTLKGGTNVERAPQIDYMNLVFQPIAQRFGIHYDCRIVRRGYYPRGGGEIQVRASRVRELSPLILDDAGSVSRITGRAFVAGSLSGQLLHVMANTASDLLRRSYPSVDDINIEEVQEPPESTIDDGIGIIVVAETSTGCRLAGSSVRRRAEQAEYGERDPEDDEREAVDIGREAAEELRRNLQHGGCVDEYLQDQLIILMALAKGKSRVRTGPISSHTETAIRIAQLLTDANFTITPAGGGSGEQGGNIIECSGIGLVNQHVG